MGIIQAPTASVYLQNPADTFSGRIWVIVRIFTQKLQQPEALGPRYRGVNVSESASSIDAARRQYKHIVKRAVSYDSSLFLVHNVECHTYLKPKLRAAASVMAQLSDNALK